MKTYEIEQYETWTQRYRVEAESEAEAIKKLFESSDQASAVPDSLEYVEVNTERGLPQDNYPEITEELEKLGVTLDDDCVIGSIASISEVSPSAEFHNTEPPPAIPAEVDARLTEEAYAAAVTEACEPDWKPLKLRTDL
jgi:hypothetical protein